MNLSILSNNRLIFALDVPNRKEAEKYVLVDFWAEWCGPCKMLSPVLESLETKLADKLKIVKIDTDGNQDIAQQYQITGIPCCILFKDGVEVNRIVGYRSESAFETELSQLMGG